MRVAFATPTLPPHRITTVLRFGCALALRASLGLAAPLLAARLRLDVRGSRSSKSDQSLRSFPLARGSRRTSAATGGAHAPLHCAKGAPFPRCLRHRPRRGLRGLATLGRCPLLHGRPVGAVRFRLRRSVALRAHPLPTLNQAAPVSGPPTREHDASPEEATSRARRDYHGQRFDNADLHDEDYTNADLSYASFIDANLRGVNFTNADLTRAVLAYADCTGVTFTGARLRDADLTGTKGLTDDQLAYAKEQGAFFQEHVYINPGT